MLSSLFSFANLLTLSLPTLFLLLVLLVILATFLWYRLQPKYFYIVRHGETLLNRAHIKQGADGQLSEKGIDQARELGAAFKNLNLQEICTSPYERAVQTATLMNEQLHIPVRIVPLLAERRNASEVIGKRTDDPEVVRIDSLTAYGYHADTYRFSDEENFEDLRTRARACLDYLERLPNSRIALVTHHAFLQVFLSYLLYRDVLTASDYVKLSFFNPASNGGVTTCIYRPLHNPFSRTKGWEIVGYNEVVEH